MFTKANLRCLSKQSFSKNNTVSISKRFNHHHSSASSASSQSEVNIPKAIGGFVLAGVGLYFYRSTNDDPIIKTPLYNQTDDRQTGRNEAYLEKYKSSFVKGFIKDRGGIGQKQFRRQSMGPDSTILIPAHSPTGDQFGAGIKTEKLGPRRERVRYFAPLSKSD